MRKEDLAALAGMVGTLRTVVLGLAQPRIELPFPRRGSQERLGQQAAVQQAQQGAGAPTVVGYDWLVRALQRHGIRVTSSEAAYDFERLGPIFDLREQAH